MTLAFTACPVCQGAFGRCREFATQGDTYGFQCDGCGQFEISRSAVASWFSPDHSRLTPLQRSALSHALRSATGRSVPLLITNEWIETFQRNARLPTPATQAANLNARIGDSVGKHGKGNFIDDVTEAPLVGTFDRTMFNELLGELMQEGLVRRLDQGTIPHPRDTGVLHGYTCGLTLRGRDRYEAEKRGQFSGHYGFIAMQFGDHVGFITESNRRFT